MAPEGEVRLCVCVCVAGGEQGGRGAGAAVGVSAVVDGGGQRDGQRR